MYFYFDICMYDDVSSFLLSSRGFQPPIGVATVADTKSNATMSEFAHLAFLGQRAVSTDLRKAPTTMLIN